MCKGWTDAQGTLMLELSLATPKGAHFLRIVECTGFTNDEISIYDELAQIIEEIGPQQIVAVVIAGLSTFDGIRSLLAET